MLRPKKYAFLTDYVRLIVVQNYGGIYFDIDVEAVRNFDDLLDNIAFLDLKQMSMLIPVLVLVQKRKMKLLSR